MNRLINSIQNFYYQEQIHFEMYDEDTLVVHQGLDNTNVRLNIVYFTNPDEEKNIQLKIYNLGKVDYISESLRKKVNELNQKYRWYKIYFEDGDIVLSTDAIVTPNNVGDICLELTIRGINICNAIYPELMRAIWG